MSERWIPFDIADAEVNPFDQFDRWFNEAEPLMHEREAIALVTSTSDGYPSARMVLLRHHDATSFGWYTNYESRKGEEIAANPHVALLWYCEPLGRQIRIEGDAVKMSDAESDAYFNARPRGHQIGAHASNQSRAISSRSELETRVEEVAKAAEGQDVARPSHWGGYRLTPRYFEFWQHRQDRLHDRVIYRLEGGKWERERQAP
jgi:pyridoxamine 5'-phosphate oxidase